jgi:hypothetical protein
MAEISETPHNGLAGVSIQGAGRLTAPLPILICGHGAHSFKNVFHTDVRRTL